MPTSSTSFRVGKVRGYLRGKVWYLCYHEDGRRHRARVGPALAAARQMAAQINGQLSVGASAALSFDPITIAELRERWLAHHEHVLRSSLQTVRRYRTATDHLLRFLQKRPVRHASQFHPLHAEEFVHYLRSVDVSPNGHPHTERRPLLDKGLRYILECCRSLFSYAGKRRHLSPYATNPFQTLQLDRLPVENIRPIVLFAPEEETAFLAACDRWQFPLFLTLLLTGVRTGELCHLLMPEDLDLQQGLMHVRNKPKLGWRSKTRNERSIPLHPALVDVLHVQLHGRTSGPLFRRRSWKGPHSDDTLRSAMDWEQELCRRLKEEEDQAGARLSRQHCQRLACKLWQEQGVVREDRVRAEFMKITTQIGLASCTAPKSLRHLFATALQEGRVDPLIRNELMGHVAAGERTAGHGLAMTAVYTHTRPETRRQQLLTAIETQPGVNAARRWLRSMGQHSS